MSFPRRPTLLLAAVLAFHAGVAGNAWLNSGKPAGDFDRYYEIATGPGRPYVDYQVEHPIGTLALFKGFAGRGAGRSVFGARIVQFNLAADLAIMGALLWGWGVTAVIVFAAVIIPMVDLLFNRIDLWSTACATVGVAAWRRDRRTITASAVACGAAFKLWPLLFAAMLVVPRAGEREPQRATDRAPLVTFLAVSLAIAAAWWAVAGTRGLYQVLTFRGATGWQIEGTVGALLHLAGVPSLRMESGSWRIGSTSGAAAILLFTIAAPLALWSVWRGARTGRVGTGWLGGVSTLLALSPLLSAQYAVWLAPGAAIAWAEGDRRHALLGVTAVLLTGLFWTFYPAVLDGERPMMFVVVARNACLLVLAVSVLIALKGDERAPRPVQ